MQFNQNYLVVFLLG